MGEADAPLAFEDVAMRSYSQRAKDFATPGMDV